MLVGILLITLVLRLAPLGRYVTPDEPAWVYRSIRFADAIAARDWAAIPDTGHPGVTTMWLGTVGGTVQRWLHPAESARHLSWLRKLAWLAPDNGIAARRLAYFLPAGRIAVASVTTLCLLLLYRLTANLFDQRVALLAIGLLAFDPFLIGHTGLLHTDALLATFTLLTLTAALNGLQAPRRVGWWLLSGLFGGLALLTKTPAVLVIPFVVSLIALRFTFDVSRSTPHSSSEYSIRHSVIASLFFLATSGLTVFILHPGLWVDPISTLETAFSFTGQLAEAAPRPIFFAGEMRLDPGLAFYPVAFLVRVSSLALIGLIAGALMAGHFSRQRRFAFLALIAFAVLFGAGISLGAKKHDRYLLPALLPLALSAALGLDEWLRQHQMNAPAIPSLLLSAQLIVALLFAAHPLTYANPLVGGPRVASRALSLDWGEGMGQAARRLNQHPNAEQLTVATANIPSFASLFAGHTIPIDDSSNALADYTVTAASPPFTLRAANLQTCRLANLQTSIYTNTAPFEQSDYLIARAKPDHLILTNADIPLLRRYTGPGTITSAADIAEEPTLASWLIETLPEHETVWLVASAGGSPITTKHLHRRVKALAAPVSTETVASATITQYVSRLSPIANRPLPYYRASFGGQLALIDSALPETVAWPDALDFVLRWRAPQALPTDHQALVTLRDDAGHVWSSAERPVLNEVFFPTSAWAAGEWTDATYDLSLPAGIPPDRYRVEVSLYDKATGAMLGANDPDGRFRGTRIPVGEVTLAPPSRQPDTDALKIPEHLEVSAGPLTLLGWDPPSEKILSGDHLSLALFWQADAAPDADYRVRLQMLDADGDARLETIAPLSPYPTSRWRSGDRFESCHTLHVLPRLPAGTYQLALNVLTPQDESLWSRIHTLTTVEVLPRERSFTLPEEIPHPLELIFGERIRLHGYALDETEASPGEMLPLTLYWQANRPTERSYTLFVHLLGPEGQPRGQVDRIPGDGAAPTTSWATDQTLVEEIALPVDADAPPGTYRIAVGFYDPAYGERLPATDADGERFADDRAILPLEITIVGDES